jgi:ABC-type transport system involved in multi-copper enzyme maturation permease subunit
VSAGTHPPMILSHVQKAPVIALFRRSSMFGPLVWWELVRLARRGDAARARVLLVYLLLLTIIGFAFWKAFPGSPMRLFRGAAGPLPVATAAEFSQSLALVLLEAQLVLVAIIAPAYAASALSEEKDRLTLPLLLTTDLTDREIVWGKAVGRVLFVLLAVLAGVPVLMITLFLGGVGLGLLASGYALTIGTALLCAAIGASAACHSPDSRSALVRAYTQSAVFVGGTLIPPFVMLSPFAMLIYTQIDLSVQPEVVRLACGFGYPVGQVAVASALIASAARSLRKAGATAGPIDRTAYPEPPRGRPAPVVFALAEPEPVTLPPVDEANPVLWKERYASRVRPLPLLDTPARWLSAMFAIIAVMLFVTGGWLLVTRAVRALDPIEADRLAQRGPEPPDQGGGLMTTAGVLAAALYLVPLAIGVAGCVAGERHRGTLDALLATPLSRWSILGSKVRAHTESGLVFGIGAITGIGCGFGADGGTRLGLAAMIALVAGFALVIALTAWLSVRCATPVRAFRLALPAVVAVIGLPVLVRSAIEWGTIGPSIAVFDWAVGICAVTALVLWWRAGAELERGE